MISCARMVTSVACLNASTSKLESARWKWRRFSEARLQAESSRYMYSEQGLEALMQAVLDDVCHALTVVSYCRPGSPRSQAAWAMPRHRSRALKVCTGPPSRPTRFD